jgi:four helix bundle protein
LHFGFFGFIAFCRNRVMPGFSASRWLKRDLSCAANHRAACRARSLQEFAAKIGIVVEEADETLFWLELLSDSGLMSPNRLSDLIKEAKELTAVFTTTYHTAKRNQRQP